MANWQYHSLKVAPQVSGFGTAATVDADFVALQCETPAVTFETAIEELELLTGQIGAAPERLVGRRSGSISFKMPLEGFKSGYDPTANNPGDTGIVPPWMCILGNVLGSQISLSDTAVKFWKGLHLSNSIYSAAGVVAAGTDSTHIVTDNAGVSNEILGGELVATALAAAPTTIQMGYVKTKAVQTLTLFEASANVVADNAANVYGTSNAWLSSAQPSQLPLTMRWVGQDTTFAYILQDCICDGVTVTWEAGAVPTIEFKWKFYDFTMDKTKGGLTVPDAFVRVPQIVGTNNGRATIGGTATCTLENCTLEYTQEINEIKCHAATQGITSVTFSKPRVKASMQVLHNSADTVYSAAGVGGNTGSHQWQSFLERGVEKSVGVYVGSAIGRVFAFLVPAGKIIAVPAVSLRNGAVQYALQVEAGAYTADTSDTAETASTSPLDSIFRASLA